ncbi:MAG TPA: SRPBCC domain-containing protein [Actinomycetes bacterium]|jgi:hypothetical protein|nr:SRPBCC domain-containing protein [Actinomycetes bacterium]
MPIEIEATPERVWQVLIDFAAYPDWNPFFITRASGAARPSERLHLPMQPPGGRGATLRPIVLEADPGRRLRWLRHVLLTGLFDGDHSCTIEPLGDRRVRFSQQEQFRCILVPLAATSLDRHTLPGLHQLNQALKRRAERPARGSSSAWSRIRWRRRSRQVHVGCGDGGVRPGSRRSQVTCRAPGWGGCGGGAGGVVAGGLAYRPVRL